MLKPFIALFAAALSGAVAFAQVGPLKPPQPNGPPKLEPRLLTQTIKPDLSVKIQDVKVSCPAVPGASPFQMTLLVRNSGGTYIDAGYAGGKSMSIEMRVDDVPTVQGGGYWAKSAVDAINSPGGWVTTQTGPIVVNFTSVGKPDPTRLATPKTVAVAVFVDSNNAVDELNENNNKDQTTFTIPAHVCK